MDADELSDNILGVGGDNEKKDKPADDSDNDSNDEGELKLDLEDKPEKSEKGKKADGIGKHVMKFGEHQTELVVSGNDVDTGKSHEGLPPNEYFELIENRKCTFGPAKNVPGKVEVTTHKMGFEGLNKVAYLNIPGSLAVPFGNLPQSKAKLGAQLTAKQKVFLRPDPKYAAHLLKISNHIAFEANKVLKLPQISDVRCLLWLGDDNKKTADELSQGGGAAAPGAKTNKSTYGRAQIKAEDLMVSSTIFIEDLMQKKPGMKSQKNMYAYTEDQEGEVRLRPISWKEAKGATGKVMMNVYLSDVSTYVVGNTRTYAVNFVVSSIIFSDIDEEVEPEEDDLFKTFNRAASRMEPTTLAHLLRTIELASQTPNFSANSAERIYKSVEKLHLDYKKKQAESGHM